MADESAHAGPATDVRTTEQRYHVAVNNLATVLWSQGAGTEALRVLTDLVAAGRENAGDGEPDVELDARPLTDLGRADRSPD
jgi:hypothetical protein